MPISPAGWLILDDCESQEVTLSRLTITQLIKHWDDARRRSFLCSGQDCTFCRAGIPQRQRWTCTVFLAGRSARWEFGADVSIALQSLPAGDVLAVTIARNGAGRMAKTTIRLTNVVDKYIHQKYGHMVQR